MATRAKAHAVLGATLSLPLLAAPMAAESTVNHVPDRLTESQLDVVAAGSHNPLECLCSVKAPQEYWEQLRNHFGDRIPKWQPKPGDPGQVTTMAVGEEGGGISPIFWIY